MPATPNALHAHKKAAAAGDKTHALLQQIIEQQKEILEALARLQPKS